MDISKNDTALAFITYGRALWGCRALFTDA
jgi:hypothetical protein